MDDGVDLDAVRQGVDDGLVDPVVQDGALMEQSTGQMASSRLPLVATAVGDLRATGENWNTRESLELQPCTS